MRRNPCSSSLNSTTCALSPSGKAKPGGATDSSGKWPQWLRPATATPNAPAAIIPARAPRRRLVNAINPPDRPRTGICAPHRDSCRRRADKYAGWRHTVVVAINSISRLDVSAADSSRPSCCDDEQQYVARAPVYRRPSSVHNFLRDTQHSFIVEVAGPV